MTEPHFPSPSSSPDADGQGFKRQREALGMVSALEQPMHQGPIAIRRFPIAWFLVFMATLGFCMTLWANCDNAAGRHTLFMDEALFYDNVRVIVSAPTPSSFWSQLLLGPDQRYGQIAYIVCALPGAVGYCLGGETGLIIAIRCTVAAGLIISYLLLSLTVAKVRPEQVLAPIAVMALCLALPKSVYYSTMPKPEPFQLLAIAIYVYLSTQRRSLLGWQGLFLGVAFAAKISTLPMLMAIGSCAFVLQILSGHGIKFLLHTMGKNLLWLLLGMIIAEPAILLDSSAYIDWTWENTSHAADNQSIGPMVWLSYIGSGTFPYTGPWLWGTVFFALLLLTGQIQYLAATKQWRTAFHDFRYVLGAGLLSAGILSLLAIIVGVHRLWDMYLHPGAVLAITGMGLLVDTRWLRQFFNKSVIPRFIIITIVGIVVVPWIVRGIQWNVNQIDTLAQRTDSQDYQSQSLAYTRIIQLLEQIHERMGRPISAVLDPHLWDPGNLPWMTRHQAWGGPWAWIEHADIVVMGPKSNPLVTNNDADLTELIARTQGPNPAWKVLPTSKLDPLGVLILFRISLSELDGLMPHALE